MAVSNANQAIRKVFDLRVVTDGVHTVLNYLPLLALFTSRGDSSTPYPEAFGFEAQKI